MMAFGAGSCGLGSLSMNYVLLQYSKRKMIVTGLDQGCLNEGFLAF